MNERPDVPQALRACVRPLLLDSGVPATPVGSWGSCILVKLGSMHFVLTAAHLVVKNHPGDVLVLASDQSDRRLPLAQGARVLADCVEDEVDLAVYPVMLDALPRREARRCRWINLDTALDASWLPRAAIADFGIVGFPRDLTEMDYDTGMVRAGQVRLSAEYVSALSGTKHLHTLRVVDALALDHFAGLSGGAVYSIEHQLGALPLTRFCGVVVQGTAQSSLVHFVEASQVWRLVNRVAQQVRQSGPWLGQQTPKRRQR